MYRLIDICKEVNDRNGGIKQLLSGITLDINDGEFIVVKGDNGAGKTTLMSVLGLITPPTRGTIILNEKKIKSFNDNVCSTIRNKEIGLIFQNSELIPYRSVMDNVIIPLLISNRKLSEMQRIVIEKLKYVGIEKIRDKKIKCLSGGEQKKVAIARAIVNSPNVIIADEPTSSLDKESQLMVVTIMNKIHKDGGTIIVVTHDSLFDDIANRELFLENGKIAYDKKI